MLQSSPNKQKKNEEKHTTTKAAEGKWQAISVLFISWITDSGWLVCMLFCCFWCCFNKLEKIHPRKIWNRFLPSAAAALLLAYNWLTSILEIAHESFLRHFFSLPFSFRSVAIRLLYPTSWLAFVFSFQCRGFKLTMWVYEIEWKSFEGGLSNCNFHLQHQQRKRLSIW